MPADGSPDKPLPSRTGLLVVCPSDLQLAVREHVSRHADQRWEQRRDIIVLPIPNEKLRDRVYVASEINRTAARSKRDLRVLSVSGVAIEPTRLRNQLLISSTDRDLTPNRFGRSALPHALKGLRLDWRASVADSLANAWDHGTVDETRIDSWLQQFEILQSHGWVGERLLRILDFWPSSRIRHRLELINNSLQGYTQICVNRQEAGKSADVMANKLQKILNGFSNLKVTDLSENLNHVGAANLMYFEDCLLTGTEITRILGALLGKVPPGRTPKVRPLTDPALIREKTIMMHFLISTSLGCETLKRFLTEEGLANIQIAKPDGDVATLTHAGIQAAREGKLFDEQNCLSDPPAHIVQVVFQEAIVWGGGARIERAIDFCGEIGQQLFRQYLISKKWEWPERRIRESSLGVRGVALALAFAHSVPKATLPLFWMEGPVRLGKKEIHWLPLFPSAA